MVFQAEAEVRWLDHCEASLVRHLAAGSPSIPTQPAADADTEVEQEVPR